MDTEFSSNCQLYVDERGEIKITATVSSPKNIPEKLRKKLFFNHSVIKAIISNTTASQLQEWFDAFPDFNVNLHFLQMILGSNPMIPFPDANKKADLILHHLIKREYKWQATPDLRTYSFDEEKIAILRRALVELKAPLDTVQPLRYSHHRPDEITDGWNEWLDERRDHQKIKPRIYTDRPHRPEGRPNHRQGDNRQGDNRPRGKAETRPNRFTEFESRSPSPEPVRTRSTRQKSIEDYPPISK